VVGYKNNRRVLMNTENYSGTLDLTGAAHLCKCSTRRLRTLARIGAVPATKVGRQWVFPTRLLQEWIDERSIGNVKAYFSPLRAPTITQVMTANTAAQRLDKTLNELSNGALANQNRGR
jgi:hypothetical protein